MRRQLTFAPSFRRGVQASSTAAEEEDSEEDDERRCAEGRAELSRSVAPVAAACRRPSPQSLPFKFWAQSSEGSEVEEGNHDDHSTPKAVDLIHGDGNSSSEPSTPVFVREALEAGFTIDQLSRAEKALDSDLPPLSPAKLPVDLTACGASVDRESMDRGSLKCIGPSKIFWPTKGLCALFRKTGTREISKTLSKPPYKPSSAATSSSIAPSQSYADVVRVGATMAAQGSGGNFGRGGGGRAASYDPGFQPGFYPGRGGRGRGQTFAPPRGRGCGHGGYGGSGYNGFNSVYNGGGRGGRPYGGAYGGGRGHGVATVQGPGANSQVALGAVSNPTMGAAPQPLSTTETASIEILKPATAPPSSNNAVIQSDVPESSQKGNKKSKGKPYCYHCHTKGHTILVCTAVLICEICFGDHVKKVCPNLKNILSTAIPCGYAVEGLGFYFIPVVENPKIVLEDKSAVVRVLEGSLTTDQLAVELDKLLPENSWVIEEKGNDTFITNFPSSEVLNHMFRGLPTELRDFPIIWAIGSILGVSQVVDTKFTKKYGRARMKVAVLNPDLIPDLVDVVIGDYVYELQFRMEKDMPDGEPQVIDMDSTMDEDKAPEEKEPENMDHDGRKMEDPPAGQTSKKKPNNIVAPSGQHMSKATTVIPLEQHVDLAMGTQHVLAEDAGIQKSDVVKPVVLLTQTGMTPGGSAQWKASLMQSKIDSGLLNKTKALSGGVVSPVRASKRNTSTSEQDSLEKATKLKARRNMDSSSIKDENLDLDALNLICAEISEDLCDGGCDPVDSPKIKNKHKCKDCQCSKRKIPRNKDYVHRSLKNDEGKLNNDGENNSKVTPGRKGHAQIDPFSHTKLLMQSDTYNESSMFITTSRLGDDTSAYGYNGTDYGYDFHTEVPKFAFTGPRISPPPLILSRPIYSDPRPQGGDRVKWRRKVGWREAEAEALKEQDATSRLEAAAVDVLGLPDHGNCSPAPAPAAMVRGCRSGMPGSPEHGVAAQEASFRSEATLVPKSTARQQLGGAGGCYYYRKRRDPKRRAARSSKAAASAKRSSNRDLPDQLEAHARRLLMDAGWRIKPRIRNDRPKAAYYFTAPQGEAVLASLSQAWRLCGQRLRSASEGLESGHQFPAEWSDIDQFWKDLVDAMDSVRNMAVDGSATLLRRWQLLDPFVAVVFIDKRITALQKQKKIRAVDSSTCFVDYYGDNRPSTDKPTTTTSPCSGYSRVATDVCDGHQDMVTKDTGVSGQAENHIQSNAGPAHSDSGANLDNSLVKRVRKKPRWLSDFESTGLNGLYAQSFMQPSVPLSESGCCSVGSGTLKKHLKSRNESMPSESNGCSVAKSTVAESDADASAKKQQSRLPKKSPARCLSEDVVTVSDVSNVVVKSCQKHNATVVECSTSLEAQSHKEPTIASKSEIFEKQAKKRPFEMHFNDDDLLITAICRNPENNEVLKDGWVTWDGILCSCCIKTLSISDFKAHAMISLPRSSLNLCLQFGKSLTLCQIEAWNAEYMDRRSNACSRKVEAADENDDTCGFCGDGGELLCCDNCPSTYHQSCLSVKELPDDSWYCHNCICRICGCPISEKEISSFSAILKCLQCGAAHHDTCVETGATAFEEMDSDEWFCGTSCKEIYLGLHGCVGVESSLGDGLSWTILRCNSGGQKLHSIQKIAHVIECNSKLAVALALMEECFAKMVDTRTGIDMIPHVMYNQVQQSD
ncbi:unnamed protein product [Miscanthus lutarioriparius]|uniref:PHD-type domain-containing protein n=1 Tax=Miscanthus lutarioriparius TaxID=422564 RepID=A0A811SJ07_9POAL|nr:unnamed protein product [Miscanthus lutarioriparius]